MKPLVSFNLRPLPASKFHTRVRVWATNKEMDKQAVADGSMTGTAQACHAGNPQAIIDKTDCIGNVYLYLNPLIHRDAIHELTHAACHYVREVRAGDLGESNDGEYASAAEEMLCESMECYLPAFYRELAQFLSEHPRYTMLLAA